MTRKRVVKKAQLLRALPWLVGLVTLSFVVLFISQTAMTSCTCGPPNPLVDGMYADKVDVVNGTAEKYNTGLSCSSKFHIRVKKHNGDVRRSYLKFDISGLSAPVSSVYLSIDHIGGNGGTVGVYELSSWPGKSAPNPTGFEDVASGPYEFDITSLVNGLIGQEYLILGLAMVNEPPNNPGDEIHVDFKNPCLEVVNPERHAKITLTPPSATNQVGDDHTFTAHLEIDYGDGAGFVDAPAGETIDFTIDSGPGSLGTPTTTDASGNATVVLSSNATGVTTVSADWSGTGDLAAVSTTSNPADKTYTDAKITLTPPSATNQVGDDHTFTAHLEIDYGDGAGFVDAPAGETIDFTITGGVGNLSSATATTNSSGKGTVTLTSTSVGSTSVEASWNGTAAGASASASDTADKDWMDARIDLSPDDADNEVGEEHEITATVETTNDGITWSPAGGVDVTFTIDSGTASFVGGTNTATTATDGTCSVFITSDTAGSVEVSATTEDGFTASGTTFSSKSSEPVNKDYLDARIDLSPDDADNEIGEQHEITATVEVTNDGSTWTPANGVEVTFTIDSGTASFVGGTNTATTATDGTCSVFITSDAAGSVEVSATTEDGFTASGTTFSSKSSDSVNKDYYVNAAIEISKTVYAGHDAGVSAPGEDLVAGQIGDLVTYVFTVVNRSDTYYLADITIDDDDLGITTADLTVLSGGTPLAPGESLEYYYESTITGNLVNMAIVTGNPTEADGSDVPGLGNPSDSDTAEVSVPAGGGGGVEASVIINEVAWAGTVADSGDEWIELRNLETNPVDLSGWVLRWRRKRPSTPEEEEWKVVELTGILKGATISAWELSQEEPSRSVRFVKRKEDDVSWLVTAELEEWHEGYYTLERRHDNTISNVKANLIYDATAPYIMELSDLGDVIELLNAQGTVVDTANAFDVPWDGWPAGDAAIYATMERTDPLGPDVAENWHTNLGIITYGLDAQERPLVATAETMNSDVLDELAADLTPVKTRAGARLEVGLDIPQEARRAFGWPWTRVTRPELRAAGGGGVEPSAEAGYSFSGRYANDLYWLGIDTSNLSSGRYNFWIIYGEGKVVLVPITVLP